MGSFSIWHWAIAIVMVAPILALAIVPGWRILQRAGFSGAWSLLVFVPVLGFLVPWVLAFVKWPNDAHGRTRTSKGWIVAGVALLPVAVGASLIFTRAATGVAGGGSATTISRTAPASNNAQEFAPLPQMPSPGGAGSSSPALTSAPPPQANQFEQFHQAPTAAKPLPPPTPAVAPTTPTDEHLRKIYAAHPDADAVALSTSFQQWLTKNPTRKRAMSEGSASDVIAALTAYKNRPVDVGQRLETRNRNDLAAEALANR